MCDSNGAACVNRNHVTTQTDEDNLISFINPCTNGVAVEIQCDLDESVSIFHSCLSSYNLNNNLQNENTNKSTGEINNENKTEQWYSETTCPSTSRKDNTSNQIEQDIVSQRSISAKDLEAYCKQEFCDCLKTEGSSADKLLKCKASFTEHSDGPRKTTYDILPIRRSTETLSVKLEIKCSCKTTQTPIKYSFSHLNHYESSNRWSQICFRIYFGPSLDETIIHLMHSYKLFLELLQKLLSHVRAFRAANREEAEDEDDDDDDDIDEHPEREDLEVSYFRKIANMIMPGVMRDLSNYINWACRVPRNYQRHCVSCGMPSFHESTQT